MTCEEKEEPYSRSQQGWTSYIVYSLNRVEYLVKDISSCESLCDSNHIHSLGTEGLPSIEDLET